MHLSELISSSLHLCCSLQTHHFTCLGVVLRESWASIDYSFKRTHKRTKAEGSPMLRACVAQLGEAPAVVFRRTIWYFVWHEVPSLQRWTDDISWGGAVFYTRYSLSHVWHDVSLVTEFLERASVASPFVSVACNSVPMDSRSREKRRIVGLGLSRKNPINALVGVKVFSWYPAESSWWRLSSSGCPRNALRCRPT